MTGELLMRKPGISPFDKIRRFRPDGSEYWSARELGGEFGYKSWRNMMDAIERARVSCATMGDDPADHIVGAINMVAIGSGAARKVPDCELTRYACYLVAMNGDSRKLQIAAAQRYFALMTRKAELQAARPMKTVVVPGEWSVRIRDTLTPHLCDVNMKHPGCFTVMTAMFAFILTLEDEIVRHKMLTLASDLPDGSIGQCWANCRRSRGLATPASRVDLYLPARGYYVPLRVYGNAERGPFEAWFYNTYLPEKLPEYLGNKPTLKPYGPLPPASAADQVCLKLTGQNAHLKPPHRKQLSKFGGFIPAGTIALQLEGYGRGLFD